MRYYVTTDPHGYYSILRASLEHAEFFDDKDAHKLVILGDLFDRGGEAKEMQEFISRQMDAGRVVLIKGNHEDMFCELLLDDHGMPFEHHVKNGTYDTAIQLTGYSLSKARKSNLDFADAAMRTPLYERIIPSMLDYFETAHYIFVHGWIPCFVNRHGGYDYYSDWRNAGQIEWGRARLYNGMDAIQSCMEEKTIVCGHYSASYGHSKYEHDGPEFGNDANFSPFYGHGIIALDACTATSKKVNVIVLEDQ